jgi:DNA mismatch endonuclease (patch repair protein)
VADKLTAEQRSENMRRIRSKDMKPEMAVRSLVHRLGYRYRLHVKDLAGKPDLVFRPRRKVIFVHGCFWHGHDDPKCLDGRKPKSRTGYWGPKLERNRERDTEHVTVLKADGWDVLIIWECDMKNVAAVEIRLRRFLER